MKKYATFIGYIALFIWACSTILMYSVRTIPTFEIIAINFGFSFIVLSIIAVPKKDWKQIGKLPKSAWLLGFLLFLNTVIFAQAFKYAPPIHIELIFYLWPLFGLIFVGIIQKKPHRLRHYFVGAFIALMGCFLILIQGVTAFKMVYLPGELLALIDAVVVALYGVLSNQYKHIPHSTIVTFSLCITVGSVLLHIMFESTVYPSGAQWIILFTMGSFTAGIAYYFWDIGMKKGNYRLLMLLSYGNPVISTILLVIFKVVPLTIYVVTATLLVSGGALYATYIPVKSRIST